MIKHPFIVYLKNKTSHKFEYKSGVSSIVRTDKGYSITFKNGRNYNYGFDKVQYYSLKSTREDVRIYVNGKLNKTYNAVNDYGSYLIFRNGENCSYPIKKSSDIEICDIKKDTKRIESVVDYFKEILQKSGGISFDLQLDEIENKNPNQISSEILLKALDKIDLCDIRSALSQYIHGTNPTINLSDDTLIYPFGCNESQKLAVETALKNSISIVEGPPGTGKTQTILNIIANLIIQNKTVAIVSNNNSAVFNVREKLMKYGYGVVVASLGNNENKASFFEDTIKQTICKDFEISEERLNKAKDEVRDLDSVLTQCFQYRNKLAKLKIELSNTEIEFRHIKAEQHLDHNIKYILDKKFYRKWKLNKTLKLKNLLSFIDMENKLSLKNKVRFILQYGFFELNYIDQHLEDLYVYVNHKFYELYIANIEKEISDIESWLAANNVGANLKRFVDASKDIFNGVLFEKYKSLNNASFDIYDYINRFEEFTKHYPVILSSTLSLHTSIPDDYLFDYLIIDESSQVDIIKSAVCFSCCRNVVVVGDSMQLTHIIDSETKEAAEQLQKEYNIGSAYDYVRHNILNSLKIVYGTNIKSVLLKEHYRCHPTIIEFCNRKYYDNNLVIMTNGDDHPFRIIETSISGGRNNYNQRQIDETDLFIRENYSADYTRVGVIAPYRKQADMLRKQLPDGVEADTIHKFQGREKDTIIFNTVKNQIGEFIDNANLINVAVSRAVKEFILIKPVSMKLPHGSNIGDLIRYICYSADPNKTIVKGSICSVFDLLYKEYNKLFTSFISSNRRIQGSPAEIIIYNLLSQSILLRNTQFSSVHIAREYRLRDLVRDFHSFTEDETKFIKNNARLDFLLYNKIDKTPILAIEVDGVSFHDNELQQQRDNKKNHILEIIGLPLLRLSTDGHDEERKIIESLSVAMGLNQ